MSHPSRTLRTTTALLTALALAVVGASPAVAAGQDGALSAAALPVGDITAVTDTGGDFTIHASADKLVTVDASARISDRGEVFTQRIKLNGTGTAQARSIHVTVAEAPTELFVTALSGSGSADRAIALYDAGGEVARVTAPADSSATAVPTARIAIAEPGEYWLASPSSGVNVYAAQLGAFDPVERTPWADVATPAITDVTLSDTDPGAITVTHTATLGPVGGDVVYATLFDSSGGVVDQTLAADAEPLTLTPPASGDYEVEVRLTRAGELTSKDSERSAFPGFTLPLGSAEVTGALTTRIAGGQATLSVSWTAVEEAETYTVLLDGASAVTGVSGTSADLTGLTPGSAHTLAVIAHRGEDATTGPAFEVTVATEVERWQIADVGSNAGSGGSVTENTDGTITFGAKQSSTKIATSEDGFQYFYTEIDPESENFALTATFRVDDASTKDSQSGFGVIAVDDLVAGSSADRYFNSAGAMITRYTVAPGQTQDGTPGARFVHGYTGSTADSSAGARDSSDSVAFDPTWRADATGPRFADGDEYTLTLRRSNTGYHAVWHRDGDDLEVIQYDPAMLQMQDADRLYVGLAVARKIAVTVTEWEFSTITPAEDEPAQERPKTPVAATLSVDVTRTTPAHALEVPLVSNMHGAARILDADGSPVTADVRVVPGERLLVPVSLASGRNDLTVRLMPDAEQPHLGEYEQIESTDPVDVGLSVTVDAYGEPGQSIHAAPDGSPDGDGTRAHPLDLRTAVSFAQPGQQVVLHGGTYALDRRLVIDRGLDGTPQQPIVLMSAPDERAVLDLSSSPDGGLVLRADWWHVYDLEVTGSIDAAPPLLIQGHHNVVERVESHHNSQTGIQISGSSLEPRELWPSDNLVVSSISHSNADPGGNDADGFAAKLTVGDGNVFRSCIAYNNIDDGWDLYAKSTTGQIGVVVIEDSVAYDNGWVADAPDRTGEGNGFKLGGESMPGAHVLRDSIAYGNLGTGVTSNSGPDVRLEDVTSVGNGRGIRLETNAAATDFHAAGVLSWRAPAFDILGLKQDDTSLVTDPSNVFHLDGAASPVQDGWFVSVDVDGIRPTIADDGSVDMHGLLELTEQAPAGTGARPVPIADPTVIEVLPEVAVPLKNLTPPMITGDAVKGSTLNADPGAWSHPDAVYAYQWLRDGEPIPGRKGTAETYTLRGADVGHEVSVTVTATVPGQDPVSATSEQVTVTRTGAGWAHVVRTLLDLLQRLFGR